MSLQEARLRMSLRERLKECCLENLEVALNTRAASAGDPDRYGTFRDATAEARFWAEIFCDVK